MAALLFLTSGGMATTRGDLRQSFRDVTNAILKEFEEGVRARARAAKIPASKLTVWRASYLFVARDASTYHVVFAASSRGDEINYWDLSDRGQVELELLERQIELEVGEPLWSFSIPMNLPEPQRHGQVDGLVDEYIESLLHPKPTVEKRVVTPSSFPPEIAPGLERFAIDHSGEKTAFIMMQFSNTQAHDAIVRAVKSALATHGVKGLRADDKQYMDDVFPNVKVYLHGCDFGVAIFERIDADDFNPNVSLEVGYMFGMRKDVLLLKDCTLKALPTDLTGRLYREFDTRSPDTSVPSEVKKWLTDKGVV